MIAFAEERPRHSGLILWLRAIGGVIVGLALGFVGLSLLFSDLGPGESNLERIVATAAVFAVGGLIVGLIVGKRLWYLSAICSWGGVLIGAVTARLGVDRVFLFLALPLAVSLIGGYTSVWLIGTLASRMRS